METAKKRDPWMYVLITSAAMGVCLLLCLCLEVFGLVFPQWQSVSVFDLDHVRLGQEAPDFELNGLNGRPIRLSHYRGQAVLLNFWATWCGYCLEEMPLISEYAQRYTNRMVVLAVSEGESAQVVQEFTDAHPFPFIFVLDPSYRLNSPYRLEGYPTTYFIDAAGIVRYEVIGSMDRSEIEAGLRAAGVR